MFRTTKSAQDFDFCEATFSVSLNDLRWILYKAFVGVNSQILATTESKNTFS